MPKNVIIKRNGECIIPFNVFQSMSVDQIMKYVRKKNGKLRK